MIFRPLAVQLQIKPAVHRGHAAGSDHHLDAVPPVQPAPTVGQIAAVSTEDMLRPTDSFRLGAVSSIPPPTTFLTPARPSDLPAVAVCSGFQ
jgi:hypothetical protein